MLNMYVLLNMYDWPTKDKAFLLAIIMVVVLCRNGHFSTFASLTLRHSRGARSKNLIEFSLLGLQNAFKSQTQRRKSSKPKTYAQPSYLV